MQHLGLSVIPTSVVGPHTRALENHSLCAYVRDGKLLWCTPQYAKIFGKQSHQIQGEPFQSIVGMHRWLQCQRHIDRVMRGESVHFYVVDAHRKNKLLNTYVPHLVRPGKVHGYYITSQLCPYSEAEGEQFLQRYAGEP